MKTSKFFEFGFATKRDLQELSEAIKNAETIDGEVSTYADLPAPANHNGEIWLVKTTTGVVFVNKKVAGLYVSNGTTWAIITPVEIDGYQKLITTPTDGNIVITDANGQTQNGNKKLDDLVALGETSSTAYRGDRGKIAYDHSQIIAGNPHNTTKADVGLSNVDNTSDINKPISSATQTALNLKQNTISDGAKINIVGSDVASASTVNFDNATGDTIAITGTTTINTITLSAGIKRFVRFTGILTLTNGASLVLPSGANITTASGDTAIFIGYASGVVRCVSYERASGTALVGGGSFNPTITSVQDGQFIKYDAFQNLWVNQYGSIDRPTIAMTEYTVSLTSSLKTQFNLGAADGVQYKLYSNAGLTNLVHDTGVLSAGANFNFTNYTTPGTTYYVIGRIRENKYNIFSSYSQPVSFLRQGATVLNNVGIYSRQITDAPANADNPNTYNPSTAWYLNNGSAWTVAQRLAISNNLGSTLGTQTIAGGSTYTFNNGVIDGIGTASATTHTLVADLGIAKNITQIYWNSMAGNTPGGWSAASYTNGILFEYWNGSAWTGISSTPANPLSGYPSTSGSGVNSVILTFPSINARYFRIRNPGIYVSTTRFQMSGI